MTDQLAELQDPGYEVSRPHRKVDPAMRRAFHGRRPADFDPEADRIRASAKLTTLFPGPDSPGDDLDEIYAAQFLAAISVAGLTALEGAVLAVEFEGCTREAIATRLGLTPKSVKNASERARAKLLGWEKAPGA